MNACEAGERNNQKGLEETLPGAHTGLRITPVPITQTVKPYNSPGIGKSTQKGLASVVGIIHPRLNMALVLCNKS